MNVKKMVTMAMMTAISLALFLLRFPIPGFPPNLKLNIADLPAAIIAFAYGPIAGILVVFVRNTLSFFLPGIGENSGLIGEFANFVSSVAFILPLGLIYKFKHTKQGALVALIVGTLCMTVMCIPINAYIMIPLYIPGMPMSDRLAMILPGYVPFNLIKGLAVSVLTFLLYKPVSPYLKD